MSDDWNVFIDISSRIDPQRPPNWKMPRRVFARVESVEGDANSNSLWIRLDGVDADWFESTGQYRIDDDAYFRTMPLFAIEFDPKALLTLPSIQRLWNGKGNEFEDLATDDPDLWIELEFGVAGFECEVYWNLTADPILEMAGAKVPSHQTIAALRKTFDLATYFTPASSSTMQSALSGLGSVDGIVVYDVGQGSAAGLVDPQCRPLLYADMGGGVTRNRHTFPTGLTHFCTCTNAAIVLSHWDWDHWASANRGQNKALRKHTWIAPLQKAVGPSHLAFARALHRMGTLHLWARGKQPPITRGAITLERCNATGRNHSGIALIVDGPSGKNPVLFPGDARYDAIPSGLGNYDSLIVPHHGADMKYRGTPVSPAAPHGRAVYSYGPGNTFSAGSGTISHPAWVTRTDHDGNGWLDSKVSAPPGQVRQTEDRSGPGHLGHVYVSWTAVGSAPALACTRPAACDLAPTQI